VIKAGANFAFTLLSVVLSIFSEIEQLKYNILYFPAIIFCSLFLKMPHISSSAPVKVQNNVHTARMKKLLV
jgi:hypothetical protein